VIDLRTAQLQSFLVLCEELHFGRAAARLGIAQSALSAHLRRLEAELGTALLVRTSRTVALTAAGAEVRAGAERLLADVDWTARRATAAAAGRIGVVRVGGTGAAMLGLVPRLIRRLGEEAPELVVEARQMPTQPQLDALAAGTLDVAFVRDPGDHAGLRHETVHADVVDAVLPADHRLAARRSVRLAELAAEPFVLWSRSGAPKFHDEIVAACHAADFSPDVAYEVVGSIGRQAFVAAGLGVGLEASASACARHRDVRFVPLRGRPLAAPIDAAWRAGPPDARRERVVAAARDVGRRLA
jgi:DNA-binding transcriptional LysR family regulator